MRFTTNHTPQTRQQRRWRRPLFAIFVNFSTRVCERTLVINRPASTDCVDDGVSGWPGGEVLCLLVDNELKPLLKGGLV